MAEERLYEVDGSTATAAERVSLASAGLLERAHLQEWVVAHPEILGEDVLVITFEFDHWVTGAGRPTSEPLDVLALDRDGRLIVAELKRDVAPDSVVVQALNYAAMASRFTVDLLVEAYGARNGGDLSPVERHAALLEWAPGLTDETLVSPRIVLVAEDFSPVVRNTVMYLIEQGLDLRLVRVQLYRMAGGSLAFTASQLLPVPEPRSSWCGPARPHPRSGWNAAPRRVGRPSPTGWWPPGCSRRARSCGSWCPPVWPRTERRSRRGSTPTRTGGSCGGAKIRNSPRHGRSTACRETSRR